MPPPLKLQERDHLAPQDHGRSSTSPSAACRRTAASSSSSARARRWTSASRVLPDAVRREDRPAPPRQVEPAARHDQARLRGRSRSSDFKEAIHQPYGMVLVTGPTGSGKTTTLYSALAELNTDQRQHLHRRGSGRVQPRRHQPGADARGHRPQLRRRAALVPAPGPGHHHGRRDPRLRDRRDRASRPRSPATWCSRRCTPTTRPSHGLPPAQHGRRAVPRHRVGQPRSWPSASRASSAPTARQPIETQRRRRSPTLGVTPEQIAHRCSSSRAPAASTCNDTGYKGRVALYEVMPFCDGAQGAGAPGRVRRPSSRQEAIRRACRRCACRRITKIMAGMTTHRGSRRATPRPTDSRENRMAATCTSSSRRWSTRARPICTSPPARRRSCASTASWCRCKTRAAHRRSRPSSSATRSSPTRRRHKFEEENELDLSFGVQGPGALPRQRLHAARRGRPARSALIPFKILTLRRARACRRSSPSCPRSRAASCWSPARPARASRRRWRR